MTQGSPERPTALIVDYGGVLTTSLADSTAAWCETDRLDIDEFRALVREWVNEASGDGAEDNPIHALETGSMTVADFETALARRLTTRDGGPPLADGLLARMFAGLAFEPVMGQALLHARAAGIATALLSNSWGLDYPREGWDQLFDTVVISGEVGLRKPDPAIFRLAARRLGRPTSECVFVDDLAGNVRGAIETGMIGVHHTHPETTIGELEAIFDVSLMPKQPRG